MSATSVIVVATKAGEFKPPNPKTRCVRLDLNQDGKPECYAWPEHGSGVGFLVLHRDGKTSLFGNWTDQKNHYNATDPRGFLALAEYDYPQGNGDTVIDEQDKAWPDLKIWIDEHCYQQPDLTCTPLDSELHDLKEFNIESIDLVYSAGGHWDGTYGNGAIKFAATLSPEKVTDKPSSLGHKWEYRDQHSKDGRKAYEVFLVNSNATQ